MVTAALVTKNITANFYFSKKPRFSLEIHPNNPLTN